MSNPAYDDGLGHLPVETPEDAHVAHIMAVVAESLDRAYVREAMRYAHAISPDLDHDAERYTSMEARVITLAGEVERLTALNIQLENDANAADSPRYAHAGKRAQ